MVYQNRFSSTGGAVRGAEEKKIASLVK